MESIVVLGLVPGTNFQITFLGWLITIVMISSTIASVWARRRHVILWAHFFLAVLSLPFHRPRLTA